MIKSLSEKLRQSRPSASITSAAIIIASAGILSRVLGLLRDRILASHFGAGDNLDVYYAAFRVPDLIYNLLVLGALSSAFIPVFTGLLVNDDNEEAWKTVNVVLSIGILCLIVICIILAIFAPFLMKLITPGFSGDKLKEVIILTRIMFLSPIFLGISGVFGGILNSFKRFLIYSLAPIMYNLGIIVGAVLFVKHLGIAGLAWGVVLGAFMHMMLQYPAIKISGFSFRFNFDLKNIHFRKIIRLMIPRTMGLAVTQINLLVITIIASTLAAGSLTIFNFANNLQSFPLGIFGIPLALAVFPSLSQAVAKKDFPAFISHFSKTFRQILYFVIPASVLLLVLRAQVVRVVLGSGKFDWEDTTLTFQCLGIFAISLFAQSILPLLTRAFYSLQNTKIPFIAGIISEVVNLSAALIFTRYWGVLGLAIAFSLACIVNMFLLMIMLHIKAGNLNDSSISTGTIKIAFSALAAGVAAQLSKYTIESFVNLDTFAGVFSQMLFCAAIGLAIYALLSWFLKLEEFYAIKNFFSRNILRQHQALPEDPTEASGI